MVYKRCKGKGCTKSPRCGHSWHLHSMVNGILKKGPVKKFAFLLQPHEQLPTTREGAEKLDVRLQDWLARGCPPIARTGPALTGNDLIDRWMEGRAARAKAKGKDPKEVDKSAIKIARDHFGTKTLTELEDAALYQRFTEDYLDRGRKLCTPNRYLATVMRPAIRWGLAQRPPLLAANPFGMYQHQIDTEAEEKRHRRCEPEEEAELHDACDLLNTGEYKWCGAWLKDLIILLIDLGARKEEVLALTNAQVKWAGYTVVFPKTKRREQRVVPFNPHGRVKAILERRRFLKPEAPIIATREGTRVANPSGSGANGTWIHAVCLANSIPYVQTGSGGCPTPETMAAYKAVGLHLHDLRHEAASWWGDCKLPFESGEWLQGHRSQFTHGRYRHEAERKVKDELAEYVWPNEHKRAVSARKNAAVNG